MKILVDTHIYLWMLSSPEKFDTARRFELETPANEVFLSVMSITELMIKHATGKIEITFNPLEKAKEMGLEILAFSGPEALLLKDLPLHHKDPFDRMLIVQSIHHGLKLMTDDEKFNRYDCSII